MRDDKFRGEGGGGGRCRNRVVIVGRRRRGRGCKGFEEWGAVAFWLWRVVAAAGEGCLLLLLLLALAAVSLLWWWGLLLCEGVEVFGLVDGVGVGVLVVVMTTVAAMLVSHGCLLVGAAEFKCQWRKYESNRRKRMLLKKERREYAVWKKFQP